MKETMMINISFNLTLEEVAVVRREQKERGKNPHQFTLHTWIEDGVHARIKALGEAQVAVDQAVAEAKAEMEAAAAAAQAEAEAAKDDAERLCA